MSWTPRQHSAALRHRAWHRVPEPRPKRPAPGWAPIGAIWARGVDETLIGWVRSSTDGSLWYAFAGYASAGQHHTLAAAKAAVDAQLRLEGWDT